MAVSDSNGRVGHAQRADDHSVPSAPLYIAAFVVLLCGIETVSEALSSPDDAWRLMTSLLTGIGLLFSFGCRRLGVPPRWIEFGFSLAVLLLAYGMVSEQFDWERFLPVGGDKSELRLASCLAWASVFWSWTLLRDDRVLFCPVLTMAVIGLLATVNPNDSALVPFFAFVLATLFLLIHQNNLRARARASQREQARATRNGGWLGQTMLMAACGLVALLLGMIAVVPAQALLTRLSLGQAIRQLVRIGNNAGAEGLHLATPFSDEGALRIGTGEGWSASAEVLMHVTPSDNGEHRWRGRTYDRYTGEGWESTLSRPTPLPPVMVEVERLRRPAFLVAAPLTLGDAEPSGTSLMTAVTVRGDTSEFYYAGQPRRILLDQDGPAFRGAAVRSRLDGRLDLEDRTAGRLIYIIDSILPPDPSLPGVQAALRASGTDDPPEIRRWYLGLNDNDVTTADDRAFFQQMRDEALQPLSARDRDNRFAQTSAIRDWVSRRCVYSLDVAPIPANVDHVRDFLGENRRGYCDLFASSMAVLCRAASIPARVATGFAPGERDSIGFNLRVQDKHAWTEVYFPHVGWIAFDPTAGSRADDSVPSAKKNGRGFLRGLLAQGPVPLALGAAILLIGLYLLKTEVLDRFRPARKAGEKPEPVAETATHTQVGRAYQRMLRILGGLGLPRRPSETPSEYADRAANYLYGLAGELSTPFDTKLVADLSAQFAAACYGGPQSGSVESDELPRRLSAFARAARHARLRLWGRALQRRLRGQKKERAWN